jgi:hypothetical protein
MRTNIRNLWQYSSGYFLTHNFVGKQEIEIQPIGMAERLIFDIRTMHERDKNMIKPKQNWIMILVKWGDSYGLSGLAGMVGGVEEANEKRLEMKKQKNTLLGYQSLMNAAYHTKLTYYQECQAMFFKAFFGSYIAFAPNQEALNSYYQQFYEWYNHEITSIIPKNDSILLSFEELTAIASEKTNTPALQAFHKKLPEITDHALVMNPEIGISLENYNLIDCVNLLKKGKINPENVADIYFCVVELPPILSSYIFEKYGFQHLKYGKSDVTTTIEQIKKDISYLQRFYQADIYNITQPNITLMDTRTLDVPLV